MKHYIISKKADGIVVGTQTINKDGSAKPVSAEFDYIEVPLAKVRQTEIMLHNAMASPGSTVSIDVDGNVTTNIATNIARADMTKSVIVSGETQTLTISAESGIIRIGDTDYTMKNGIVSIPVTFFGA